MPYPTLDSLPDTVKQMPEGAQHIFQSAFNAAFVEYKGDEGKAHAVAYAAVKTKYEQDKDGKWVVKESREPLRVLYAEIIQESARRVYAEDKERIKKVLELCQSILSTSQGEEIKTEEAIKECESCLTWLKEQASMKTEDGVQYPSSAFAYAPDPEKPSDWKLRLWEDADKKMTRAQLGRAAAALSPGGFRGQKVEIPAADMSGVKRKIRAAYKSLDVADEDIPRWVQEVNMIRDYIHESITIPLNEGTAENMAKGIVPIRIIQPGFNASKGRHYSDSAVKDAARIFEGAKMFSNHATKSEEKERPERDIRDWVATIKNAHVSPAGTAVAEAHVHAGWLKEMISNLKEQGNLDKLGVSINSIGKGSKQKIDGVETFAVEALVDHPFKSVDFVTEAGAGGQVGVQENASVEIVDAYLMDLVKLKEARPDLVKEVEIELESKKKQEVKKTMELQETVDKLTKDNEVLVQENETLKGKINMADKARAKAEAQVIIKETIAKATLPDAAKVKLQERFKDVETDTGVAEAVKAESDYITALSEAGKVKGMGPTKEDPNSGRKAIKEAFIRSGMTPEKAEIAANAR